MRKSDLKYYKALTGYRKVVNFSYWLSSFLIDHGTVDDNDLALKASSMTILCLMLPRFWVLEIFNLLRATHPGSDTRNPVLVAGYDWQINF